MRLRMSFGARCLVIRVGCLVVRFDWTTRRDWLAHRMCGSWFGAQLIRDRELGLTYARLFGLEAHVGWWP